MWPAPIGKDLESALTAFENIRHRGMAISQWTTDEQSIGAYEAKIQQGLMSAGVRFEAARAVAREQIRLIRLIEDAALNMASAAKLAADKLISDYAGPIEDWRNDHQKEQRLGLKVR